MTIFRAMTDILTGSASALFVLAIRRAGKLLDRIHRMEMQMVQIQADLRWIKHALNMWVGSHDATPRS